MKPKQIVMIALGIILLDQLSKLLIKKFLHASVTVIPLVLNVTYLQNTGVSFGMLQKYSSLLVWIHIIVIGLILWYYSAAKEQHRIWLALILSGAVGNVIDRLVYGYVMDFIDFKIWPVFNVADSAITIGGIMLAWYWLKEK